jgi:putative DNA primase/helicase
MTETDRARVALKVLNPGMPRKHWIGVGMAAKAAGLTCEDFTEWSRPADNFKSDRDCKIQWDALAPFPPLTADVLFGLARKAGWIEDSRGPDTMNGTARKPSIDAPTDDAGHDDGQDEAPDPVAMWDAGRPAHAHPYVIAGRLDANAVRVDAHDPRYALLPLRDFDGVLVSLQRIPAKGRKLNLEGVKLDRACCYQAGDVNGDCTLYVAEGGKTLHAVLRADYHAAGMACVGVGRFEAVAREARRRWPKRHIVLVADRGTEDITAKAARAARAAWVAMPGETGRGAMTPLISKPSMPAPVTSRPAAQRWQDGCVNTRTASSSIGRRAKGSRTIRANLSTATRRRTNGRSLSR